MKGATQCARRLKTLLRSLRSKAGKAPRPPVGDPTTQMVLGILSRDATEPKAREALDKLCAAVVDYNDLRVIDPLELTGMIADYPDARRKCEDLSRALNRIFALEHVVSLEGLASAARKDVAAYLDQIDGLDPYSRARTRLLGLGQHAIPLDEAMWAYARQCGIVDAKCALEEAQAFLERQVPEKDGLEFFATFRKQAWSEMGTPVRKRQVARIQSAPPDRTTRNMLQTIAAGGTIEEAMEPTPFAPASGLDLDLKGAAGNGDNQRAPRHERLKKPKPGASAVSPPPAASAPGAPHTSKRQAARAATRKPTAAAKAKRTTTKKSAARATRGKTRAKSA